MDRREFMKAGVALAAVEGLGSGTSLAALDTLPAGTSRSLGRMAWPAGTWFRPYASSISRDAETTTWIQIDLGRAQTIESVRLYPAFTPGDEHANGYGFPVRFRIEASDDSAFASPRLIVDRCRTDFPDPFDEITDFGAGGIEARYVRLTATHLRKSQDGIGYRLAIGKIDVVSGGRDMAEHCAVTADDAYGNPKDVAQITRSARPMGEGIVTNHPENVTSGWKPVSNLANAPLGGVRLGDGVFKKAMADNIEYLLTSFSVDDMLRPFRERAGKPVSARMRKPIAFWETTLPGSSAGRFMMGAGNTLRWTEHEELRANLNALVDGIEECKQSNGYIMAYPEEKILHSERGGYTRAWVTHGLIEAGFAGNEKAFSLLRGFYDWFNECKWLPWMMRGGTQGVQGMIASTRMFFTPEGKPRDIQTIQRYYQENYWLDGLAARNKEVVWQYPYDRPHNYLITDFEAYLDVYRATGDKRYLEAMNGAWDLYHDHWEHVGGSIAITEFGEFPPGSYRLNAQFPFCETGETCGSVFWARFNQRFQMMAPDEEKYANEIEKSIYNVGLANQVASHGIIYHARLVGMKGDLHVPLCTNSCCEGQGTRLLGSLAEYIYSIAEDGIYVNLYEPSTIEWRQGSTQMKAELKGSFPASPEVRLEVTTSAPTNAKIRIRVPQWSARAMEIAVNGRTFVAGEPGSYVVIDRTWTTGDAVQFSLPMRLKLTRYTGLDRIQGHERYALEYGPILMALIGSDSAVLKVKEGKGAEAILAKIKPDPYRPLHFTIDDHPGFSYVPYWQVISEPFTCFPVIDIV